MVFILCPCWGNYEACHVKLLSEEFPEELIVLCSNVQCCFLFLANRISTLTIICLSFFASIFSHIISPISYPSPRGHLSSLTFRNVLLRSQLLEKSFLSWSRQDTARSTANKNQTRPTVPDFRRYKQSVGVRQFVWGWLISARICSVFQGSAAQAGRGWNLREEKQMNTL